MPTTAAPRSRTRASELRDRSSRDARHSTNPSHNSEHPVNTPSSSSPSTPKPHLWYPRDVNVIGKEVNSQKSTKVDDLFPKGLIPEPLNRKSRVDIHAAIAKLHTSFDNSCNAFVPNCSQSNYMATLAAETTSMATTNTQRDAALASLTKSHNFRIAVEKQRARIVADCRHLSSLVEKERTRRGRNSSKKSTVDKSLDGEKRRLDMERDSYTTLRDGMEAAKFSELDVRRRLDRMRLKIAAMRGEMVIPTVDKLARASPQWLGEIDESVTSGDSDPTCKQKQRNGECEGGEQKGRTGINGIITPVGIESPTASTYKDDLELNETAEEIEFRLLKNRLAMCEMEAREWEDCVQSEREKVRLIFRAKTRLEDELTRLKQSSGGKCGASGGGRNTANSLRMSAKLHVRAAIRAHLPIGPDPMARKAIRKPRKSRPRRSLAPEL